MKVPKGLTPMSGARRKSGFLLLCGRLRRGQSMFIGRKAWKTWGYAPTYGPRIAIQISTQRGILKGNGIFSVRSFKEGWVVTKKGFVPLRVSIRKSMKRKKFRVAYRAEVKRLKKAHTLHAKSLQ